MPIRGLQDFCRTAKCAPQRRAISRARQIGTSILEREKLNVPPSRKIAQTEGGRTAGDEQQPEDFARPLERVVGRLLHPRQGITRFSQQCGRKAATTHHSVAIPT